ncbi:MAG: protein kinase, partial [Candidatus Eremiobacterota bacterium]
RIVAVKCLPITDPTIDKDAIDQLEREAKILKILSHENLPSIYDYFKGTDPCFKVPAFYIVMDFIEGKNLLYIIEEHRKEKRIISEIQALSWIVQICKAVEYIHTKAIIHRDIKPQNLILDKKGRIFLVDFGISKIYNPLNPVTTKSIKGRGTPGYAPPEQYGTGEHTDIRSDIYAIGATLYSLLTGEEPPAANSRMYDQNLFTPPTRINKNLSPSLEQCILKAMALMVKDRYNSVGELLEALTGKILEQPLQCPNCLTYNSPRATKCLHCDTSFITGKILYFNFKNSYKKPKDLQELIEVVTTDRATFQDLKEYHFFTGDLSNWLSAIGYGNYAAEVRDIAIKWKPYPEKALWIFLWKAGYSKIRFHDGEEAENINQFINLSLKYPDIGEKMLYNDLLIEWLKVKEETRGVKEVEDILKSKWSDEPETALLIFLWRMGFTEISFSSSEKAENIDQFIKLSDKYPDTAKDILYSGILSEWLKAIGEKQAALKSVDIVKNEKNKDIGLENLLKTLGIKSPELSVSVQEINMGSVFQDINKKVSFEIINKSRGWLHGKLQSDKDWCVFLQNSFNGNKNTVEISVDTNKLGAGGVYKANVTIKSNGGDFDLPVVIKVIFPWQKL